MMKFYWDWKKKKFEANFEQDLTKWAETNLDIDEMLGRYNYEIRDRVKEDMIRQIHIEIDKEIVEKLVKEISESFDYKETVKSAFNNRLKKYLAGMTGDRY